VTRVLRGRDRAEAERFIALRSHYGFDSFFCIPGQAGAHEKGGVEGEIGRFRRRHLVPVPSVASLAALNQRIAVADIVDDGRVITGRPATVAAAFAAEQPAMLPLPTEMFDPARLLQARVDNRARVCVRYWDAARRARGDAAGTRALTEILLGHRTLPAAALTQAMDKAVTSGALDPHAVLIDARRLTRGPVAPVIPIGALARYDRPTPALTGYDLLLSRSTR
jgi:hypothetical protein